MSDDYQRIELITGTARRRRWTTEQKLRIIEAGYAPGEIGFLGGAAAWGGAEPALPMAAPDGGGRRGSRGSDETVVGRSEVRRQQPGKRVPQTLKIPTGTCRGTAEENPARRRRRPAAAILRRLSNLDTSINGLVLGD